MKLKQQQSRNGFGYGCGVESSWLDGFTEFVMYKQKLKVENGDGCVVFSWGDKQKVETRKYFFLFSKNLLFFCLIYLTYFFSLLGAYLWFIRRCLHRPRWIRSFSGLWMVYLTTAKWTQRLWKFVKWNSKAQHSKWNAITHDIRFLVWCCLVNC